MTHQESNPDESEDRWKNSCGSNHTLFQKTKARNKKSWLIKDK